MKRVGSLQFPLLLVYTASVRLLSIQPFVIDHFLRPGNRRLLLLLLFLGLVVLELEHVYTRSGSGCPRGSPSLSIHYHGSWKDFSQESEGLRNVAPQLYALKRSSKYPTFHAPYQFEGKSTNLGCGTTMYRTN